VDLTSILPRRSYTMAQIDKRIEWKTRLNTWKLSKLSVAKWCKEQGIDPNQMYYWIRKFKKETMPSESFSSKHQRLSVM